jgi:hypothetical protein
MPKMKAPVRGEVVAGRLSEEESKLLNRYCLRKGISRADAVLRGLQPAIQSQRQLEALAPMEAA